MKTLILVRHAKSSWKHEKLSDFERPLSKRGARDAPRMGKRLSGLGVGIDAIVASPAARAAATARALAEEIGFSERAIQWERVIYGASTDELLEIVVGFDDAHQTVLMVGHNPGFGDLTQHWERSFLHNLPTCGIVRLDLHCERWADAPSARGRLVEFLYPKQEAEG